MPQYFDSEPSVTSDHKQIDLLLPDVQMQLTTDRGVFSADRVDSGSKFLLLDGPDADQSDRVLADVGCGYGPIACTVAMRNPNAEVWAVDVNARARELCATNAAANNLDNVRVISPEEIPEGLLVDRIWSNPPIRIGKKALHALLDGWLARLGPSGTAHLVVQKHLGADSLHRRLETEGWLVNRRAARKAFRLLDVQRATGRPDQVAADQAESNPSQNRAQP